MTEDETLLADLKAHETRIWEALVSGDAQTDAYLLHPDFLGIYPDGFAGKSDHVGQLDDGPSVARFEIDRARAIRLGSQHASLSYRATFARPDSEDEERMYITSIWQRAGEGWVNLLSQDTPADS